MLCRLMIIHHDGTVTPLSHDSGSEKWGNMSLLLKEDISCSEEPIFHFQKIAEGHVDLRKTIETPKNPLLECLVFYSFHRFWTNNFKMSTTTPRWTGVCYVVRPVRRRDQQARRTLSGLGSCLREEYPLGACRLCNSQQCGYEKSHS